MRCHRMITGVLSLGLGLVLPASAWGQQFTDCQRGEQLRDALGLGLMELASMGADATTRQAVQQAAEEFYQENHVTIEPLLDAAMEAKEQAFRAYELDAEDIEAKDQACTDALAALVSACGQLITTMDGSLTETQQSLHARGLANPLMDSGLCFLDLTSQQRSDIRTAQRARDEVLRHHKLRKNLSKVRQAHAAFETALDSILTSGQKTERQSLATTRHQNLHDAMVFEEAACTQ